MELSREELSEMTRNSADPNGRGAYINRTRNMDLTDSELVRTIMERNEAGKDTYQGRREYERRLSQRESQRE